MIVCLTPDAFDRARAGFGSAHHVGRLMPRELPKSWGYLQYGWNTCARTPVASAIESITDGDQNSVTFHLFGDGKKKTPRNKKKNKKKVRLTLPQNFDVQVDKVAALVDYFANNRGTPELYNKAVTYQPSEHERELTLPEAAPAVVSAGNPPRNVSMLKQQLRSKGVINEEMIRFVFDLSCLVEHQRSPDVLVNQWRSAIKACSSHWYPPPVWWCVATTLVGDNLINMTRQYEGGVVIPATCLENWDMFTLLKLLQTNVFPNKVNNAAEKSLNYTRNNLAHERFDCDWVRDWSCMEELLTVLGCSIEAGKLRKFCDPLHMSHCDMKGNKHRTHAYAA